MTANQTALGSVVPLWAGGGGEEPVDPVAPATVDYYVSPSLGSDNNAGTQLAPFATLAHVESILPDIITTTNYRIHLRAESYPLPSNASSTWLRSRIFQSGGRITIFADNVWDPAVYAVAVTAVAAAGTGANVVVTAGLVANAQRGRTIRFTNGAASGQFRRINANTTTNITPSQPFNPAPAPGDTFEIITLGTTIAVPAATAPQGRYLFHDAMLATGIGVTPATFSTLSALTTAEGVHVAGVIITAIANVVAFGAGPTYLFGVESPAQVHKFGGQLFAGIGPSETLRAGWGVLPTNGLHLRSAAIFAGYFHSSSAFINAVQGCVAFINGGFCPTGGTAMDGDLQFNCNANTPFIFDNAGALAFQLNVPTVNVRMNAVAINGGIQLDNGATLSVTSSVTGQGVGSSVLVRGASKLLCTSAPVFGDAAANDWTVLGAAPFNKAALAVLNSAVVGTDTSVATRTQ